MDTDRVKIIVEVNGHRLVIDGSRFEHFALSIPSEIVTERDGNKHELGHSHISLTGQFETGYRPQWEEISE